MDSEGGKQDEQSVELADGAARSDSAAFDAGTTKAPDEHQALLQNDFAAQSHTENSLEVETMIATNPQPELLPPPDDSAYSQQGQLSEDGLQDQPQQQWTEITLAHEQNLVPDVRRVPRRHRRCRRRSSLVSHKYVL